ncbi:MAG: hypothetical protein V1717_03940 [Candidatus Micrarchaeota archaeon]
MAWRMALVGLAVLVMLASLSAVYFATSSVQPVETASFESQAKGNPVQQASFVSTTGLVTMTVVTTGE